MALLFPPISPRYPIAQDISFSHFNTNTTVPDEQLLAWQRHIGPEIYVSSPQIKQGFNGAMERYYVNGMAFSIARTDALTLERSLLQIASDKCRGYTFQIIEGGAVGTIKGALRQRRGPPPVAAILVLDMNQPFLHQRQACLVHTIHASKELTESLLPDADSIHGLIVGNTSVMTHSVFDHIQVLDQGLSGMTAAVATKAIDVGIRLVIAACGQHVGLSGNTRAIARAKTFGRIRVYVASNLHQIELSPQNVIQALGLPHRSVYRMFEHEGGLATYIRKRRLREAAEELVRFPKIAVMDIAFGLGFKSASDFSHAFRRAYGMAPQEFRRWTKESDTAQIG